MSSKLNPPMDKTMTTEQFTQVVDAILQGKYSWACVLILRFAGYNPLHYIPYRTYNRLTKENQFCHADTRMTASSLSKPFLTQTSPIEGGEKGLSDLNYLEPSEEQTARVQGGRGYLVYIPSRF